MRKAAVAGAAAALVAVVLSFTALAKQEARAGRPSLRVVRASPLAVRGEHFRDRERVRLTAGAKTLHAMASSDGVFVVAIRGASRCDSVRVLARGSDGSYAVVKVLASPQCLPVRAG